MTTPRPPHHRRHYTRAEIEYIRARFPVASITTIAREMNRTRAGVASVVARLDLRRTAKQTSALYSTWSRRRGARGQIAAVSGGME